MTIHACYQQLGGDFAAVETRLRSVSLITKFIARFLDDGSFSQLCRAMDNGRREEAFRAAHTLKGVCANLGFDRLSASAGQLAELLRGEGNDIPEDAVPILDTVKRDYALTVNAIRAYLDANSQA